MQTFSIIYTLLGGLGIFFFGMKFMSDGLQGMTGDMIRKIMNSLSTNRLMAVGAGVGVTMLVQSSSVTSVMVVGMVNAGLMTLKQAIGVIFGANIGTTITGWFLAVQEPHHGLLLIALGFAPGFSRKGTAGSRSVKRSSASVSCSLATAPSFLRLLLCAPTQNSCSRSPPSAEKITARGSRLS